MRCNAAHTQADVFVQNTVRLTYQSPAYKNRLQPSGYQLSDISDDPSVESDYSLKSQHRTLINSKMSSAPFGSDIGDSWGMALPPPAEFSDDTGMTSEAGTENGEENIPTTNIDDILSDYAPSLSNQNSPEHHLSNKHQAEFDDFITADGDENRHKPEILFQIKESPHETDMCLESNNPSIEDFSDSTNSTKNNNDFQEQNQIMDIFDSYLTSGDEMDGSLSSNMPINMDQFEVPQNQSTKYKEGFHNKQNNPPSHNQQDWLPCEQNKSTGHSDVYHVQRISTAGKETNFNASDDETVVPVSVNRELTVNSNWSKFQVLDLPDSSVDDDVNEEAIVPYVIEREKKVALNQHKPRDISPPNPSPRNKAPPKPQPRPRKKSKLPSESDENVEEIVVPVQIKKEHSAKVMEEKLDEGMAEEEFIVPQEEKRENAWNGVQLVVMTNKWASLANEKKSNDKSEVFVQVVDQSKDKKEEIEENNRFTMELPSSEPPQLSSPVENVVKIEVSQAKVPVPKENAMVAKQPKTLPDSGLNPVLSNESDLQSDSSSSGEDIKIVLPQSPPQVLSNVRGTVVKMDQPEPSVNAQTLSAVSNPSEIGSKVDLITVSVPQQKEELYDSDAIYSELESNVKNVSIIAVKSAQKVDIDSPSDMKGRSIVEKAQDSFDEKSELIKVCTSSEFNKTQISPSVSPPVSPTISKTQITVNHGEEVSQPETSELHRPGIKTVVNHVPATKPVAQYKTVVPVTTRPQSLLGTIRSQTSTGQMKPLSSIKPLKINMKSLSKPVKFSTTSSFSATKPSLLSTLHGSSLGSGAKSTRSEDIPFQVSVMKGILGLGIKMKVTPEGYVQVSEVQSSGPIAKDGNIR